MEKKSTFELAHRLNQIRVEEQKLWIEASRIIDELHERLPHLKNAPDFQPKRRAKRRYEPRQSNKT